MPILTLTDAQARKLAKAIAKASYWDRDEPARELAGDRASGFALLWSLQERGLIELGRYEELWDGLAEHFDAASLAAVTGLLRTIRDDGGDSDSDDDDDDDDDSDDDSDDDDPFVRLERRYGVDEQDDELFDPWTGFWPEDLDRIVLTSFLREPSAFDGLEAELCRSAARGLASVRLRAGQEVPEAMIDELLAGYAKMLVHGDGGPSEMLVVEGGAIVTTTLFEHGQLGPHARRLVERLGGEPAFRRHVLAAALSASGASMELEYAKEAFDEVDDELLPYLLSRVNWGNLDNVERAHALFSQRKEPPERLMTLADALGDERYPVAADVCRTCAVLRWAAEGRPVPDSVDDRLVRHGVSLGHPPRRTGFVGLSHAVEALRALGTERAAALLHARLDASLADAVRALPLLSAIPDPTLVPHALEVVGKDLLGAMAAADDSDVPIFAWRLLGDAALEGLAARLDALVDEPAAAAPAPAKGKGKGKAKKPARAAKGKGDRARIALHRAILAALDAKAERDGGELDPRWDRFLGVDALPGKDDPWTEEIGPFIRHVLRRLRPQDRDRVLDGMLERGGTELPRIFALLDFGSPELRARVMERFATAPELRCERTWMAMAANRLGVAFHAEVRALLGRHPEAEPRVAEALGRELLDAIVSGPRGEHAEALRKAVAKAAIEGPHETIHVLEPWDDVEADASIVSRVGRTAIGVPRERWPLDLEGAPMRHMMTLRLADVPELAARHPGKVALAVFVAANGGHAYDPDSDDAAVLLLDEADLAHGELDLTRDGGDGDEDDDDDDEDLVSFASADTRPFHVVPVEVPVAALGADERTGKALRKLHEQIEALPGRVGGPPGWLTGEVHDGRFVLQFDDDFESLPVPGQARMLVFEDTAVWQTKP